MKFEWLNNITNKILNKTHDQEEIICQCGLSTTGRAHIGNFRELIISYLISENLKMNGKKVRIILSFDDFDRFKKVPIDVDNSYHKYIGMPNYSFPSHVDSNIGYAKYYENKVIEELNYLGIEMEYIYQSKNYLEGKYDEYIEQVLNKKEEIYNIVKKYKTQELTEIDKLNFYPIKIYCSSCNKDFTTIKNYNKTTKKIKYTCTCGNCEEKSIKDLNIKLKFNVEWPIRWNYENVDFEPCGKGHTEELGVLNVASEINEKIFNKKNPVIISYDFFNLKGNKGRMNKNSKDIIKISDVIKIMPREMILYFFLRTNPKKQMYLSLTDDIPKIYEEYEKFIYDSSNQNYKKILKIEYDQTLKFADLIKYLPIVNFDIQKLKKYIKFNENSKEDLEKIKCAINWLELYCNNKYWKLNSIFNIDYYNSLSLDRKNNLIVFNKLLNNYQKYSTYEEFSEELKKNIINIKDFYNDFYKMVFNTTSGIPLKKIIENYNINLIKNLLPKSEKLSNHSNINLDTSNDEKIVESLEISKIIKKRKL